MDIWNLLAASIAAEFSDIADQEKALRICIRLLLAVVLGGLLGYEREYHGKSAGLRTHMLVSLGAALFALLPSLAGTSNDDISRVLQGIITGVGFLGAGTILKGSGSLHRVHGLTTAAGIWTTAAIGAAAGLGYGSTAVLSTLLMLLVMSLMRILEQHAAHKRNKNDQPPEA
ncbi:MgtC/SapB family protein [Azomonas macrocytogenes]|uniref:Protein MgtC n=1 Tax=Azomonas macrocytogenes TaxID=69962 RepID=A0A839T617_AZOMA|nr:MgtC/SapB family protein [Azomonas macrocytogenes]MBB3104947.1 putative Mg2+ transporter-C (MgtC) family protein [Azomonas macrocytogenes]